MDLNKYLAIKEKCWMGIMSLLLAIILGFTYIVMLGLMIPIWTIFPFLIVCFLEIWAMVELVLKMKQYNKILRYRRKVTN